MEPAHHDKVAGDKDGSAEEVSATKDLRDTTGSRDQTRGNTRCTGCLFGGREWRTQNEDLLFSHDASADIGRTP